MYRRKFLALLSAIPFIPWGLRAAQAEPIIITQSNLTIIGPKSRPFRNIRDWVHSRAL